MQTSQKGFATATLALLGFTVIVGVWFFWNHKLSDIDKAARDLASEVQPPPVKDNVAGRDSVSVPGLAGSKETADNATNTAADTAPKKNGVDAKGANESLPAADPDANTSVASRLVLPGNEIYTPLFEQYKVDDGFKGAPAPLDFSGSPGYLNYKTMITNGYNAYDPQYRSNIFAGHYVFTAWGCGTSCRSGVIIDLNDGKIYQIPGGEGEAWPEWGYHFVENSGLLVINPIGITRCTDKIPDETTGKCEPTKFYLWENDQFKKISIDQSELISNTSKSGGIIEKASGIIKQVYGKDGKKYLVIDYISWTNAQYYTNDNPALRTFEISESAVFKMLHHNFDEWWKMEFDKEGRKEVDYPTFNKMFDKIMQEMADGTNEKRAKPSTGIYEIEISGGKIIQVKEL